MRLSKLLPVVEHTYLSIGDDAAAVALPAGELLLITTDMLMEDVHFRLSWRNLPALGWKALAQNLSDIAAMGGTPTDAVIAIAIPNSVTPEMVEQIYTGMAELAREAKVDIIGGDTVRSSGPLVLSLTVHGRVAADEMLTRVGARAGDALYVTGTLGRAAAGLQLLDSGREIPIEMANAVDGQLRPIPRLAAGRALACSGLVSAMMDLSDGVATDIHRMCRASGVGVSIDSQAIPIAAVVNKACSWLNTGDPLKLALTGGEDFELMFTASPDAEAELRTLLAPLEVTRIGVMTASSELLLSAVDGETELPWGFTHF